MAESFKCKPIEGMLSHQLKQGKIDGEKTIIQNPNEAQRKEHEKCDFELHEVYAIDVLVSTGEGIVSGLRASLRNKINQFMIFAGSWEGHQSVDLQENWGKLPTEIEGLQSSINWSNYFLYFFFCLWFPTAFCHYDVKLRARGVDNVW